MLQRHAFSFITASFSGLQQLLGGVVVAFMQFRQPVSLDAHDGVSCATANGVASITTATATAKTTARYLLIFKKFVRNLEIRICWGDDLKNLIVVFMGLEIEEAGESGARF